MAKIPFNIKYRPQIESGEYKVILDCGIEAEILAWNKPGNYPIVCMAKKDGAIPFRVDNNGKAYHFPEGANYSDLFIVTSEEEMTEFEMAIHRRLNLINGDNLSTTELLEETKGMSTELLDLAREQFIKDGYVIEKKVFRDAVENISDKNKVEMSVEYSIHCKFEDATGIRYAIMNWDTFQKVAQKFINIGKEEILKNLPRWEKSDEEVDHVPVLFFGLNGDYLHYKGCAISVKSLEKLPGFKED